MGKSKKSKIREIEKQDVEKIVRRILQFEDFLIGQQIAVDMYDNLKLNEDIESQMDDVLHGYQFTGNLEAHAGERHGICKVELDQFQGELDEYAREQEIMSRPTDTRVKNWINREEEFVRRKKKLLEFERLHNMLKHMNKAFYMQYELIRTKSANLRKESGSLGESPENPKRFPRSEKKRKKTRRM